MKRIRNKPQASAEDRQRVLLVDDHPIVCEGLTQKINDEPDLVVCGQARDAHAALEAIENLRPDIAVVSHADRVLMSLAAVLSEEPSTSGHCGAQTSEILVSTQSARVMENLAAVLPRHHEPCREAPAADSPTLVQTEIALPTPEAETRVEAQPEHEPAVVNVDHSPAPAADHSREPAPTNTAATEPEPAADEPVKTTRRACA